MMVFILFLLMKVRRLPFLLRARGASFSLIDIDTCPGNWGPVSFCQFPISLPASLSHCSMFESNRSNSQANHQRTLCFLKHITIVIAPTYLYNQFPHCLLRNYWLIIS